MPRQLGELPRFDAVVGALVRATGLAVAVPVVHEHVLEADPVGVAQQLRAASRDPKDRVALGDRREVAQAVKAGGLEDLEVLLEVLGLVGT